MAEVSLLPLKAIADNSVAHVYQHGALGRLNMVRPALETEHCGTRNSRRFNSLVTGRCW